MAQAQVINKGESMPFLLIADKAFVSLSYYTAIFSEQGALGGLVDMSRQYSLQDGRSDSVQIVDDALYLDRACFVEVMGVLPDCKYDFIKIQSILSVLGANELATVERANSRIFPTRHFTVIDGGLS